MNDLLKVLLSVLVVSSVGCDSKADKSKAAAGAVSSVSPTADAKSSPVDEAEVAKASWKQFYPKIEAAVELYKTNKNKSSSNPRNVVVLSTDIKKTDSIIAPYKATVVISDSNDLGAARLNFSYSLDNGVWKMSDATYTVVSSSNSRDQLGTTKPLDWKSPPKDGWYLKDYMPK